MHYKIVFFGKKKKKKIEMLMIKGLSNFKTA